MATVSNTITLRDRMSATVERITQRVKGLGNTAARTGERMTRGIGGGAEEAASRSSHSMGEVSSAISAVALSAAHAGAEISRDIGGGAEEASRRAGRSMRNISNESNNARLSFGKLGGAIIVVQQGLQLLQSAFAGLKNVTDVADSYTLIDARLGLILEKGQTLESLQEKVYQSAERAHGSYEAMAGGVAKMSQLAKTFKGNNDDVIRFTELLQKSYVVGGASAQEQAAGIYQITQALTAGKLQGDEFRSVLETSPMFAEAISKQMGIGMDKLKDLSSEGIITADIMKEAMFNAGNDINRKFESIPMTFGQAFIIAKDKALRALQPVFITMTKWLNEGGAEKIERLLMGAANAALAVGSAIMFVGDKWDYIQPLIVAGLIVVADMYLITAKNALIAGAASVKAGAMATWAAVKTGAAWALANWPLVAMVGTILILAYTWQYLNDVVQGIGIAIVGVLAAIRLHTLLAFWPLTIAVAVIGIMVAAAVAMGATFADVFGFMGQLIGAWVAGAYNNFMFLWNYFIAFGNFVGNFLFEPVYSAKKLIGDLVTNAIGMLSKLAEVMDRIFKTNTAGYLNNLGAGIKDWVGKNEEYKTYFEQKDYMDINDAIDQGNAMGRKFIDTVSNGAADAAALYGPAYNPGTGTGAGTQLAGPKGTANDPVNIKSQGGEVSISEEDLKFMRDMARVQFVNKITTLRPSVSATFGDVTQEVDVKKVVSYLADVIEESTASALS